MLVSLKLIAGIIALIASSVLIYPRYTCVCTCARLLLTDPEANFNFKNNVSITARNGVSETNSLDVAVSTKRVTLTSWTGVFNLGI